jgi:hypothetical protein
MGETIMPMTLGMSLVQLPQDPLLRICEFLDTRDLVFGLFLTCSTLRERLDGNNDFWQELFHRRSRSKKYFADFKSRVFLKEKKSIQIRIQRCQQRTLEQWGDHIKYEYTNYLIKRALLDVTSKEIMKIEQHIQAVKATKDIRPENFIEPEKIDLAVAQQTNAKQKQEMKKNEIQHQLFKGRFRDLQRLEHLRNFYKSMKYIKYNQSQSRKRKR